MSARKLAVELAALAPAQRRQLLAEIPAHKREQLNRLIEELQPMLAQPSAFEAIITELAGSLQRGGAFAQEFLRSEAQLLQLLRGETIAVKKQMIDIFIGGQQHLISGHVKAVLLTHLEQQAANLPQAPVLAARKKIGWARFWK